MRISKIVTLLLTAVMVVSLSGCDKFFIGGESQLMRPPFPAGEARRIQEQLTKKLGVFTMKYPKNGDYRSAIIQIDLTGDEEGAVINEALVFYRKDESEPISLAVLEQNSSGWQVVDTKKSEGGEVERVMFGDIDGDGRCEIIVGWTMYSTGLNIISAYSYHENRINAIDVREFSEAQASNISVAYTDMQIHDFDNDGCDEIIASYINLSEVTATAKLIEFHRGVMSVMDTTPLDGHVLYYAEAKKARLTDDQIFGVVLDGYKDNSKMITEYIYWDATTGDLKAPFYNAEEKAVTCTARSIYTASRDIDSDDVIDIPVTEYLPGYDEASDSPMYLTSWYNADFEQSGYSFIRRKRTVINTVENYSVTWQSSWDNNVTCRLDERNRILYFYRYQKDKFAFSDEIFRIRVYSDDDWKQQLGELEQAGSVPDYTVLAQDGDTLYIALFAQGQNAVDKESVTSYFTLMK